MKHPPYLLDDRRREIVVDVIRGVCEFRQWQLFAVHARPSHVHVVVDGDCEGETIVQDFKEYASRYLNRACIDVPGQKRWTRHASVRMLPDQGSRERAIHYVAENQGEPLALFVAGQRAS